ncbi:hypothetical protein C5167_027306 [Papaver somniferum]|nr:hypothetical protein C5167_027306 [Papaver somniferum]
MSYGSSPIVNVPSVHELVKEKITEIPDRYIRGTSNLDHEYHHSADSSAKNNIPIIDLESLLYGESESANSELENLHSACQHWGFFQGGVGSLLPGIKKPDHESLLGKMAKALKMNSDEMEELFNDCSQRMRINYYPPCPKSQQVIGLSPHSDAAALTIVLQLNETEVLQIRKDGKWVSVKPIPGALVVNIGDMIEILSNGAYPSIEHRVMVNPTIERLSIATFHSINSDVEFGPALSLINQSCKPALFRTETVQKYYQNFFAQKLNGKANNLDFMRI